MRKTRKIAFEEHFMAPGFEAYSNAFIKHIESSTSAELSARLGDIGELRLSAMDEAGIDVMVLSQTGPSVQAERDEAAAIRRARENNDYLAEQIGRHPTRFAGFATLPMATPDKAAEELSRAVEQFGFRGALVHGHTAGRYYDDPAYDVVWERLQALDLPVYLHPADFAQVPALFEGHPELHRATWGWGVETGTHALRLLFGGVFDRFPDLKLVLGHMAEGLPMLTWRFDSRFAAYPHGISLRLERPSAYFGRNILATTTGVCSAPALVCAIDEWGPEGVLFSVDYPYESCEVAAEFIENAPLTEEVREMVCFRNAERLLKIKLD